MTDDQLRNFCFENNIYIAGGYALGKRFSDHYAQGNDIDLFCENKDEYNDIIAKFYKLTKVSPHKTDRANIFIVDDIMYQFIIPNDEEFIKHGKPKDTIKSFDLSACQIAMIPTAVDWTFIYTLEFKFSIENNIAKIINYGSSPLVLIYRLIKYAKKGFGYDPYDILKLMQIWRNNNLQNCYEQENAFIGLINSGGK